MLSEGIVEYFQAEIGRHGSIQALFLRDLLAHLKQHLVGTVGYPLKSSLQNVWEAQVSGIQDCGSRLVVNTRVNDVPTLA